MMMVSSSLVVALLLASASGLHPRQVEHPRLRALGLGEELDAGPCGVKRLAARPSVFLLRGVLGASDCGAVRAAASASGLAAAETVCETADARRRCDVAWLPPPPALTNAVAGLLLSDEARAAPGSGCEDLQVVRYDAGGSYETHHDAAREAPRAVTVLYYLNGVGNTWLPLADDAPPPATRDEALRRAAARSPASGGVRCSSPAAGDALAFFNFDPDSGGIDWAAIHAALPADAEKWVANHWFHVGGILDTP